MAEKSNTVFYVNNHKYNCYKNGKPYFRKSVTINGERRTVYGDGEKDANNKIEELKNLSNAGLDLSKKDAKVGFVLKEWLYNIKRVDSNIKASTFSRYDSTYRNHIDGNPIALLKLSSLSSANLQAYITSLYEEAGLSVAGVKNVFKVWKMFCDWAVGEGYLTKNPCRNITISGKKESRKEVETFTSEERRKLLQYMNETDYQYDTVIRLAFATGMRMGEILALEWEDIYDNIIHVQRSTAVVTHVDKDGNRDSYREVWDTKTANSVRNIPLLPSTSAMLSEHHLNQKKYFFANRIPQSKYVFTTESGQMIDSRNFSRSYKRLLERAEIPYRKFHAIRHTFATEAIRAGVDVKDLQMLLGHSDIQVTYNIYVHSNDDSKKAAINLLGEMM